MSGSERPLEGQVALVTGASRGIGRAVAGALAARGAHVAINYRNREDEARACLTEVEAQGATGELLGFDVADPDAVKTSITALARQHGRLDILINNAGMTADGLILRYPEDDWQRILDVNLGGAFRCTRTAARFMAKGRYGRVVNLSSVVASMGNSGQAAYAATKAGLEGMTRALARELAGRGVTVNAVAPGFIDTEMTAALPEEAKNVYLSMVPLGRLGSAAEVASVVAFLAGPEASYVTGHVLAVNGGLYT